MTTMNPFNLWPAVMPASNNASWQKNGPSILNTSPAIGTGYSCAVFRWSLKVTKSYVIAGNVHDRQHFRLIPHSHEVSVCMFCSDAYKNNNFVHLVARYICCAYTRHGCCLTAIHVAIVRILMDLIGMRKKARKFKAIIVKGCGYRERFRNVTT